MKYTVCKFVSNVRCHPILENPNACLTCDLYLLILKDKINSSADKKINS